jgi:hypothetical protein
MTVSGQVAASAIRWTLACLPSKSIILEQDVAEVGRLDFPIDVPTGGCGAQRLSLVAQAGESANQSDFAISEFSLTAAAR